MNQGQYIKYPFCLRRDLTVAVRFNFCCMCCKEMSMLLGDVRVAKRFKGC